MRTFRILVGGWIAGGLAIVVLSGAVGMAWSEPLPAGAAPGVPMVVASTPPDAIPRDILIPVRGIEAQHLRDTFTHARGGGRTHHAMDIMAPRGTPVVAAVDGTIRKLFTSKAGGVTLYQFDVNQERVYYYAHLDRYAADIREGLFVEKGTVIGYVGTTGNTRGTPHLHFAIEELTPEKLWWKGTPINPFPVLTAGR